MTRSAAFFDLDKTIVAGSSTLAFGRPLYKRGFLTRPLLARLLLARLIYRVGGADHRRMERTRAELERMVQGWDVSEVHNAIAAALPEVIPPMVYAEAAALIAEHKAKGDMVFLVSSSATDVVGPVGELLGVDDVIATRMVVDGGRLTGEISFWAYAETKAAAIRDVAEEMGFDLATCAAYSDSITDRPMLEVVGRPHAVNPDKALRTLADEKGWPILTFARPRRAQRTRRVRTTALAGAGILLATRMLWSRRTKAREEK